jgi:hypothetical protein
MQLTRATTTASLRLTSHCRTNVCYANPTTAAAAAHACNSAGHGRQVPRRRQRQKGDRPNVPGRHGGRCTELAFCAGAVAADVVQVDLERGQDVARVSPSPGGTVVVAPGRALVPCFRRRFAPPRSELRARARRQVFRRVALVEDAGAVEAHVLGPPGIAGVPVGRGGPCVNDGAIGELGAAVLVRPNVAQVHVLLEAVAQPVGAQLVQAPARRPLVVRTGRRIHRRGGCLPCPQQNHRRKKRCSHHRRHEPATRLQRLAWLHTFLRAVRSRWRREPPVDVFDRRGGAAATAGLKGTFGNGTSCCRHSLPLPTTSGFVIGLCSKMPLQTRNIAQSESVQLPVQYR